MNVAELGTIAGSASLVAVAVAYAGRKLAKAIEDAGVAFTGFFNNDAHYEKAWVDLNEIVAQRIIAEEEDLGELELEESPT